MKFSRVFALCAFEMLAAAALCASLVTGSVRGVVRDTEGKPLAGVRITITSRAKPMVVQQAMSDSAGNYTFCCVAAGEYTLTSQLSGFAASAPILVDVKAGSASSAVNIVLAPSQAETQGRSRPALQASGIHGLIDPGGYSASTNGQAANGILEGMAEVQRNDDISLEESANWPCDLEPDLKKALVANPDAEQVNRRLGEFYLAHHEPAAALPLLQRAVQIDSGDAAAVRALGTALIQSGQFDQARALLTPLLQNHNEPALHKLLASALEGSGMFMDAAEEYRAAASIAPDEGNFFGAGYELILAGSPADALKAFQDGIQDFPRSISLRIGAGTAQFLLGHTADSLHSFLSAADMDPSDPRTYPFLAAASGVSGDETDRVQAAFQRFLDLESGNASANYYVALMLSRTHATAASSREEALLRHAITFNPGLAEAHLLLADIYGERKDYEDAIQEYEAAIRLKPELANAHYRLALAYKRDGRTDDSQREMQIFRQANVQEATAGGISVAKFVSVMQTPASHSRSEGPCPVHSHN